MESPQEHLLAQAIQSERRYDIDALRAFAMLLGIGLHVGLSLSGQLWIVMDSRHTEILRWFVAGVHGFRMQLFFLISGYFTALLLTRRGWKGMLANRFLRITVPCLLGYITIIQLNNRVTDWAIAWNARHPSPPLIGAIVRNEPEKVATLIEAGADIEEPDTRARMRPLFWAALNGNTAMVESLLDQGTQVNGCSDEGITAMHAAAFMGRIDLVKKLANRGGDCEKADKRGITPLVTTFADESISRTIFRIGTGQEIDDWKLIQDGRGQVRAFLGSRLFSEGLKSLFKPKPFQAKPVEPKLDLAGTKKGHPWIVSYYRWMSSEKFKVEWGEWKVHLFDGTTFGHLWFLWFLTWIVPIYAILAGLIGLVGRLIPIPLLPLFPSIIVAMILTLGPQWCMGFIPITGQVDGMYGPDTSIGILPRPHMLVYYGIFFFFGAQYYRLKDKEVKLTRGWWAMIPIALFGVLPIGMYTLGNQAINAPAQTAYTWLMVIGMIGLFYWAIKKPSGTIRYISDSSYWLYLAHLPLVIALQALVCDWPLPTLFKFVLLVGVVTVFLLFTYQLFVRSTWLGLLLNGRRDGLAKGSV